MNKTDLMDKYLIELKDPKKIKEKEALFSHPIKPIKINKNTTIKELLDLYESGSFQSRALGQCAHIFDAMLRDKERPTILLGLAAV